MPDNTSQTGSAVIATNDIGGVHFPKQKVHFGGTGVATPVSAIDPMPAYQPDRSASGTFTTADAVGGIPAGAGAFINAASTAGSIISLACLGGDSTWSMQFTSLTGGAVYFEGSMDTTNGTDGNWLSLSGRRQGVTNTDVSNNAASTGIWRGNVSGLTSIRARLTGVIIQLPAVLLRVSNGTGAVFLNASLPAGTNPIGSVIVGSNSLVSTVNSSTANLGANAVFTGTSEDVSDYSTIVVSAFSSHASATDGLQLQQSPDNVNWDHIDAFALPATTGRTFNAPVQGKHFRVVLTNGGTATSSLRLQTIFSKSNKKGSSVRPQDARSNENDFEEILSYLMGYNGATWDRLRSTIANGLLSDVSRIVAALPTGTNSIGTVQQAALTKGTQSANGVTTQDLKDAGRNARAFMLDAYVAAPAAEALQSVVQWYGNAAVAATTTPAVTPTGKILRLTSWTLSSKSLATVGSAILRIRANTAGVAVIGSPLAWSCEVGSRAGSTTVAMTGGTDQLTGVFPEGFEFPAGTGLGFTLAGYGPAGALALQGVTRFAVYGYEY